MYYREKRGLQGFTLFSFSFFTCILWQLLRINIIKKIMYILVNLIFLVSGSRLACLCVCGGGGGVRGANVHTKNKLLGANVRGACSAGRGVKCPFLLIFIEEQISWRGRGGGGQTSGDRWRH